MHAWFKIVITTHSVVNRCSPAVALHIVVEEICMSLAALCSADSRLVSHYLSPHLLCSADSACFPPGSSLAVLSSYLLRFFWLVLLFSVPLTLFSF